MEPATETNQANRELTTTEIHIAIAQIEDRLMRVAKAQRELSDYVKSRDEQGNPDELYLEDDRAQERIRLKYDIPDTVHLFSLEGALTQEDAKAYKKHIAAFVRGRLTEDAFFDMIACFEEETECDYGWIMAERPMRFYAAGGSHISPDELADIIAEMKAIGSRNLKARGAPRLNRISRSLSS